MKKKTKPLHVRIEVRNGVAYVAEKSAGVEVVLIDYDEMEANEEVSEATVYESGRRITASGWSEINFESTLDTDKVVELKFRDGTTRFGRLKSEHTEDGSKIYWIMQSGEVACVPGFKRSALPKGKKVINAPVAWRD